MGALSSLSTALTALRRTPAILAAAFVVTALTELMNIAAVIEPRLANVTNVGWLLVWPLVLGGLLGTANEALDGSASLATFAREAKANYRSLLGATLAFAALFVGAAFVWGFVTVLVGAGALATGDAGVSLGLVATIVLAGVVLLGPVWLFLQFYDTTIVVGDADAFSALPDSVRFVRRNVLGAIGYTVLFVLVTAVGQAPGYYLFWQSIEFATDPSASDGAMTVASETTFALSVLATVTLGTIAMAFAFTYHVAYFKDATDEPSAAY